MPPGAGRRCSTAPNAARPIAAQPDDIEAVLSAFEAAMFSRSEAEADAHRILELCLGERTPFGLVEFSTGVMEGKGEGDASF